LHVVAKRGFSYTKHHIFDPVLLAAFPLFYAILSIKLLSPSPSSSIDCNWGIDRISDKGSQMARFLPSFLRSIPSIQTQKFLLPCVSGPYVLTVETDVVVRMSRIFSSARFEWAPLGISKSIGLLLVLDFCESSQGKPVPPFVRPLRLGSSFTRKNLLPERARELESKDLDLRFPLSLSFVRSFFLSFFISLQLSLPLRDITHI
jgi:hypothetical protein